MRQLTDEWSRFLRGQPETGMGYQVVSVTLRDGRKVDDVAIVDATIVVEVRGYEAVPFDPHDIASIAMTHRPWKFRR
jgi:hypothetical protein